MINHILPIFSVYFCENIKIYDKRRVYTFIHRGAHNFFSELLTQVSTGRWCLVLTPYVASAFGETESRGIFCACVKCVKNNN